MADDRDWLLRLFEDYDLERWTDGSRDAKGRLIWHDDLPRNRDWDHITMVTVNYDPEGEGNFRNIPISPDRPLDPFGSNDPQYRGPHKGGRYGLDYYYDLDDLATNFYWMMDTPGGSE